MSRKNKILSMVEDHDRFIGIGNVKQSGYLAKQIFSELINYVDDLEERVSKLENKNVAAKPTTTEVKPKTPAKPKVISKNKLKLDGDTVKVESESAQKLPSKRPVKKNVKV